jgi:hypothetical protein
MVNPYLMTEPLTSTRHYGRYRTVTEPLHPNGHFIPLGDGRYIWPL